MYLGYTTGDWLLTQATQKCLGWASAPVKTPQAFTYEMAPHPLHRVMTAHIPHDNALTDYTALAIRSARKGKQLNMYNFDFEVDHSLLRGTRVPKGKGVAMDAYGIHWIVIVSGRTLLTGSSLVRVFPWVLGADRPPRYAPVVSIGQVTITEDWTQDDDYVLEGFRRYNSRFDLLIVQGP